MRAWQLNSFSIDQLSLIIKEARLLLDSEVRVKFHASSLNYRDLMVVRGQYNPKQKLPLIPLSDGAGEVVEVGHKVKNFTIGDKVCPTFSQEWNHGLPTKESYRNTLGSPNEGTLTTEGIFNSHGLVKFPKHLSYEEAATLPCAGVTAFNAMFYHAKLKPGQTVLIEGTGGVSLFSLLFAKMAGIKPILLSSSDEKLHKASKLADISGINYKKEPHWHKSVLALTNKKGVDAVIEVGGAKTIGEAISSTKTGGIICTIGVLSGTANPIDLRPILMNAIRIQGVFVGSKNVFIAMNKAINHSKIKPIIDRVFSFTKAKDAFNHLAQQKHFGKVCINNNEEQTHCVDNNERNL